MRREPVLVMAADGGRCDGSVCGRPTRQWGFLVSCFAYGFVYARNLRAWRREIAKEESPNLTAG